MGGLLKSLAINRVARLGYPLGCLTLLLVPLSDFAGGPFLPPEVAAAGATAQQNEEQCYRNRTRSTLDSAQRARHVVSGLHRRYSYGSIFDPLTQPAKTVPKGNRSHLSGASHVLTINHRAGRVQQSQAQHSVGRTS